MAEPRTAVVTGGGSGIGLAAALALAQRGMTVVVADVDADLADSTAESIRHAGGAARGLFLDVTDEAHVREAFAGIEQLECAVNSAGIQGDLGPAAECTLDNWQRTLAVNLTGLWLCLREEIIVMLRHGSGSVVNVASNFGLVGKERIPAYVASKHGVVGLTKSAALDYAPRGIRINAVCPGPTQTPLLDALAETGGDGTAMLDEVRASVPLGRVGRAEEVAEAIAWLCSDAASFVTGAAVAVDGGFVVA